MLWILLLTPFAAGLASMAMKSGRARRFLLVCVPCFHFVCSILILASESGLSTNRWLGADELSLLFLLSTSAIFTVSSFALNLFLREHENPEKGAGRFSHEAFFAGCVLLLLGTTTLAILSLHTGVFWMALEATTLASAPLISYQRSSRSLEAAWKYLLICSVGIAIALVGNTALAVSTAFDAATQSTPLTFHALAERADLLHPVWLKIAFAFILVGYGTKMGLAPMHTWLPDAYSESPSPISALLSGTLVNCAFLGILRTNTIMLQAGVGEYSGGLLLTFGLLSLFMSGWFILQQGDFKRLLGYSSVEHMGILAMAVGAGGGFGVLFHSLNHSLTKGLLFLVAGNILSLYRTKSTKSVTGILRVSPVTGLLWLAGFCAISGLPPFGIFVSKFSIMLAIGSQARWGILGLFLLALGIIFVGMWRIVIHMTFGAPPESHSFVETRIRPGIQDIAPIILCSLALLLGLWLPPPLARLIERAAVIMIGGA